VTAQPVPVRGSGTMWCQRSVGGVASTVPSLVNGRSIEAAYRRFSALRRGALPQEHKLRRLVDEREQQ
jgi:hypothetical protein